MAVSVEELVLEPFREVMERGNEAVANAEAIRDVDPDASKQMLRSARSLAREGERALQKVPPIWKSQVDKLGGAFIEAIRQNDQIVDSQRRLEDLLYDLDDFVEVDSFDAEKFSDVQAASKSFALVLLETIKRMHIPQLSTFPPTPAASPDLTPEPELPPIPRKSSSRRLNHITNPEIYENINVNANVNANASIGGRRPSSPDILGAERNCINLVTPSSSPTISSTAVVPTARTSAWVKDQTSDSGLWPLNNTIPEGDQFTGNTAIFNNLDSLTLQGADVCKPLNLPNSPGTTYSRASWYTATGSFVSGPRSSINVPTSDQRTTSLPRFMPSLSATQNIPQSQTPPSSEPPYDDGLMLVNEIPMPSLSPPPGYPIGLDSSLYVQKGFCPGAQMYQARGKQATKVVMEYGTRRGIARCLECEFAQSLIDVELDSAKDSSRNFCKAGVIYRLRFLYKSHMISTSAFTMQFGCLFCAQKGQTVHADDATVFTTLDQLFQHLARHPQPLPEVPGVEVLYGRVAPDDPLIDDYDLHLPNPPKPSLLPDAVSLAKLPAAVALKSHIKRYGRDLMDPDGSSDHVLQFHEGARIVGIEFPDKWKGKWCTGWHDGLWGSFPLKSIMLEPPAHTPRTSTMTDSMFVTTRWKWDVKDPAVGWLSFDKDETLSNVSCLNQDDWCWSGTNKHGKTGLFPRSHVKWESSRSSPEEPEDDFQQKKLKKHSFGMHSKHSLHVPHGLHGLHIPHGLQTVKMKRMTIGSSGS
ncbi:hypothetical protein F5B20DRAFT_559361 [Whalleya microplaca]|nr:hypothetical protein F5B20DRAFT_559361 [Whalleya microplaca]